MNVPSRTAPLGCLSPDLVQNTPRFGQISVPQSPSLPSLASSPPKHARQNSDVQGMVARFNSLDIKDHAELRKRDEAALKRAQMGREEAESELKRQKEETRRLKREQDEAKERERKVVKRIDVLMEELHRAKEAQQHAQAVFEKEIRRARKEAFKSSSAVVKMQEELKSTRNQYKIVQVDLSTERHKTHRKDQDIFEAQCKVVDLQDNLTRALAQIKTVEKEREALKMSLQKEDVAHVAAQGNIALPSSPEDDLDEFSSPKMALKHPPLGDQQQIHYNSFGLSQQVEDLRLQLKNESRDRALALEQVDFLKLECQFGCCSCRIAEAQGLDHTHVQLTTKTNECMPGSELRSSEFIGLLESVRPIEQIDSSKSDLLPLHRVGEDFGATGALKDYSMTPDCDASTSSVRHLKGERTSQMSIQALPCTIPMTVRREEHEGGDEVDIIASEAQYSSFTNPLTPGSYSKREHHGDEIRTDAAKIVDPESTAFHSSETSVCTITCTTTIPLVDESTPGFSAFFAPGSTLSREEALERIRERRGRAKSVTGTPKRAVSVARTPRRDISAPERCKMSTAAGKYSGLGR